MQRATLTLFLMTLMSAMPAHAEITVTKRVVQEGEFFDQNCKPDDSGATEYYDPCRCSSSIKAPQINGMADAQAQVKLNNYLLAAASGEECAGVPQPKESGGAKDKKDKAAEEASPNQISAGYEILLQNDRLISLFMSKYSYSGGAHGGTIVGGILARLDDGTVYELKDLIAPEQEAQANAEIHKQLVALGNNVVFEDVLADTARVFIKDGACDGCEFSLTPDGLDIVFQQYAVGPYASGNITVSLPPELLADATVKDALTLKQ